MFPLSPKGEAHASRSHSPEHKMGFGRLYWILGINHLEHSTCTSLLPPRARMGEFRPQMWNMWGFLQKHFGFHLEEGKKAKNFITQYWRTQVMHFPYNPCSELKAGRKMALVSFEFSSVSKHSRHWWDLIISWTILVKKKIKTTKANKILITGFCS